MATPTSRRRIRGVLLDLSGTLHVGQTAIDGAGQAVKRLQELDDVRLRVLTNTSTTSSSALFQQLQDLGFDTIKREQIFTSVLATRNYLEKNSLRPFCLMEDISDFVGTINMDPPHNCVVVGLAPTKFEYLHLNQAYKILQEYPDNLIAIHRGNYIKTEEDGSSGFSLGPGAFVAALEAASSGTTAKVMGKPSLEFYQSVLWNEVEAAEVCMVGDDVIGDIQGAQQAGIGTTILVQTGKYRMGDESKCAPTIMVPSIVEAVDYILSHSQGKSS